MTENNSILLLGSTGYTGKLILKYLASHPAGPLSSYPTFTLGLAGRSVERLQKVASEVGLKDVPVVKIDVMDEADVKSVIKDYRVVVTSVGPFWSYGKAIAGACAQLGVHYVDTTGETYFIKHIIDNYDYLASKTGAILIPSAGMDSVPSDMSAFLGVRTLQKIYGPNTKAQSSTSAVKFTAFDLSGGTAQTMMDLFGGAIPKEVIAKARSPYSLSPVIGRRLATKVLTYKQPFTNLVGGIFFMSPVNSSYVRRTWGLFQSRATNESPETEAPYGENFTYIEFQQTSNIVAAWFLTMGIIIGVTLLRIRPFRWFARKFVFNKPGNGPPESELEKGSLQITNITVSELIQNGGEKAIKTVVKGRGEPGYFLTAVMTSEVALGLLPNSFPKLTKLGKKGGVLTSMSALGMELIERLKATGRFEFESGVIEDEEERKQR